MYANNYASRQKTFKISDHLLSYLFKYLVPVRWIHHCAQPTIYRFYSISISIRAISKFQTLIDYQKTLSICWFWVLWGEWWVKVVLFWEAAWIFCVVQKCDGRVSIQLHINWRALSSVRGKIYPEISAKNRRIASLILENNIKSRPRVVTLIGISQPCKQVFFNIFAYLNLLKWLN